MLGPSLLPETDAEHTVDAKRLDRALRALRRRPGGENTRITGEPIETTTHWTVPLSEAQLGDDTLLSAFARRVVYGVKLVYDTSRGIPVLILPKKRASPWALADKA